MHTFRYMLLILIVLAVVTPVLGDSQEPFEELLVRVELNPRLAEEARQRAMTLGLPIEIYFPHGVLMYPIAIENGQPQYAVFTNLAHPAVGGTTMSFTDIEAQFDLSAARVSYSPNTINQSTKRTPAFESALGSTGVVLVLESLNRRVLALDPLTGDILDTNFIAPQPDTILGTPIQATASPWGTITISDQIRDVVREFSVEGEHLRLFAPAGGVNNAILDNIRGHAYRPNDHLITTPSSGTNAHAIAEFDTGGNYVGNFVANGAGGINNPWSILYRDTDILITTSSSPTGAHRVDHNGVHIGMFAAITSFPQQVIQLANGNIAIANFSGTGQQGVRLYAPDGTYLQLLAGVTGNRGVWELENGNLLTTNGSGIHEIDTTTGALVRTLFPGSGRHFGFLPPISTAAIAVTAPNGGEMWVIATSENITWTATGDVDFVNIDYSTNGGSTWLQIATNYPALPGSYAWMVPNTPSTDCLVRVSSATNSSVNDVSNATFTITAPGGPIGWQLGTTGVTVGFDGLYVLDAQTAWVSGDQGRILRTTDGGASWTIQPTPVTTYLYSINFVNSQVGYAAGGAAAPGPILKTTNGGTTWTQVGSIAGLSFLHAIEFINADTGWVGGTGGLVSTTNGGSTWVTTSMPGVTVMQIDFATPLVGWYVTATGGVFKTTNGGATWTAQSSGTTNQLHDIHALNENVAWLVGNLSTARKTTNGGATWTPVTLPIPSTIWAWGVHFADEMTGWISGDQGWVIKTTNGGTTWTRQPTPPAVSPRPLYQIKSVSPYSVFIAGDLGTALYTHNGGDAPLSVVAPTSLAFGSVSVGNDSTRRFTIRNTGTMALTVNELTSSHAAFSIVGVTTPVDVGVGDTLFVPVRFAPSDTGLQSGMISVGSNDPYNPVRTVSVTGRGLPPVGVGPGDVLPTEFELSQNYPNPFNPSTTIKYALPVEARILLKVYNVLGQEMAVLENDIRGAGYHELQWDTKNSVSGNVPSGLYFLRLHAIPTNGGRDFIEMRKMILLK